MGHFPKGAVLSGFGEPPTLFKKPTTCRRCGKPALYWAKHRGDWRLHSWAIVGEGKPALYLHQCGIQADGSPSKWPAPATPKETDHG